MMEFFLKKATTPRIFLGKMGLPSPSSICCLLPTVINESTIYGWLVRVDLMVWLNNIADVDSFNRKIPKCSKGSSLGLPKLPSTSHQVSGSQKLQGMNHLWTLSQPLTVKRKLVDTEIDWFVICGNCRIGSLANGSHLESKAGLQKEHISINL